MIKLTNILTEWLENGHFLVDKSRIICKCCMFNMSYALAIIQDDNISHQAIAPTTIFNATDPDFLVKVKKKLISDHMVLFGKPPYGPKPPHQKFTKFTNPNL